MPIVKIARLSAIFRSIRYKYDLVCLPGAAAMDPTRKSSFAVFVVTVGIITFVASGVTALREAFWWLKYGYWRPILVMDAFRWIGVAEPSFDEWVGAQKLWNILHDSPLSLVFFGLGVIIVIIGRYFLNDQNPGRAPRRLIP